MLSQNPDKKPLRSHRGNKSPRKQTNSPAAQNTSNPNISTVKTRSALKSPSAAAVKIEKTQQLSDQEEELDDFVNEIDRALNKSKSKRKRKQQVKQEASEQSSKKDSSASAAKKSSNGKTNKTSSKSQSAKKSKNSSAVKSEFSFKKSSSKTENVVAEASGTVTTSQKSQVREKQQKVRQWIDLKSQTIREEEEKKALSLLDLIEAVIEAQKQEETESDVEETKFDQIQWCDIYEGSQSFYKLNPSPKVKYVQKLILNGLDLLAQEGRYDLKVTSKIRSDIKSFENLVKMTQEQINKK